MRRVRITGRDDDRIRNFPTDEVEPQSDGGSEFNVGGCVRMR